MSYDRLVNQIARDCREMLLLVHCSFAEFQEKHTAKFMVFLFFFFLTVF